MMQTLSRIGFVSLGCPKALVDSERIITQLRAEGYEISPSYEGSDLVVINTCGFIDEAIEESLDAIGEALNENGKVIVTGCLGAKGDIVRDTFPDVLAVTGPHDTEAVIEAIHEHRPPNHDPYTDLVPPQGIRLTPGHYAYLKISEGCNHHCSFCIIPSMRGRLVSRGAADVMQEAENLVNAGVRELLVISQDTSAYGADINYRTDFWKNQPIRSHITDLGQALGQLGVWIRLHYVYPYPHVDELIPLMADGLILPYLDIPLQHASPKILKSMKRPANSENVLERIRRWREICPEVNLRSTFIVGFPGETDDDFEALLEFIQEANLDRVGCFEYSDVDGAASNMLAGKVAEEVRQERFHRFMETQLAISRERLQNKIGQIQTVLVDEVLDDVVIARSQADAPEIDGRVIIEGPSNLRPGDLVGVTIINADEHDLFACV